MPVRGTGVGGISAIKVRLIYAYHRERGKIVTFVRGKRDLKTAEKLKKRLQQLGISYDKAAVADWDSFQSAFSGDKRDAGKEYIKGIWVLY